MTSSLASGPTRPSLVGTGSVIRRSPVALLALLAALVVAGMGFAAASAEAADRNFAPRFTANDTGDIDIFGNTLMTCPAAAPGCTAAQQAGVSTVANSTTQNNAYVMQYVDVDGDATTFNSSRSTVTLPAGSQVLFAGLYWGARTAAGSGGSAARNIPARNTVKFKAPGAAAYTSMTADTLDDGSGGIYQGFADVTDEVKAGGNGQYTVADVQASTGADTLAGWSLVIAYRDTTQPARNLSVFDGIKSISSGASGTISVSGFTTPPAGDVRTRVGFVNYEGDGGIVGDSASLNGTTLSDAQHPATNFFNSRSSRDGVLRTATDPNYPNQLGIEQSILLANGILGNNATSATISLTSSGDVYAPGVVTFATELYAPKVEQTKTVTDVNGGLVEQGDTLRYTISGTNTGQDGATNFILRDPIPTNTTYVPGTLRISPTTGGTTTAAATDASGDDRAEYDAANRRIVARLGTGSTATAGGSIAPNVSYATTFDVVVGGPNPGVASNTTITNVATATFASASLGTPLTAQSTATATVKSPDLTITKTGSGAIVRGAPYDYSIVVRNAGDAKTQGTVTVTDTLPTGLSFRGATPVSGAGWSCTVSGTTFTCTRTDALAAGTAYPALTLNTTVAANAPATIANTATVSGGGDGTPGNNTGTATNNPASSADLAVEKTADTGSVAVGGNVTYTLKVTNNGTSDSTGSVLSDTLPAGLTYVSSDAACTGSASASAVTCTVGPLAANASKSFTVVASPARGTAGTTLRNTVSVSGNEPDPTAGNNTASRTVDVKPVDLQITNTIQGDPATLSPNTTYTWVVGVSNQGGSPATSSVVRFDVPDGTTVAAGLDPRCTVAGGVITCNLGTIAPGVTIAPLQIPLTTAANPPASIDTVASVTTTENDIDLSNNTASTSTPVVQSVDLGVTLGADPGTVKPGDEVKLTATVTNNGPATPQNPTVTIAVPTGTTFVRADPGCTANAAGTLVTCILTPGELDSGESVTRTVVVKAGDDAGTTITTRAAVDTTSPDTDPSNDTATLVVPVVRPVDLSVTKTASATQAKPGDRVVYTLTARNAGPGASRDSVVTDTLPAGTTFVSSDDAACSVAGRTVTCDYGTIPAGESRQARITVSVDPISTTLNPNATHQYDVVKKEETLDVPPNSTGTVTARCDAGYVATDGSVLLKSTDQDTGSFGDTRVTQSRATDDGTGWVGTALNSTSGRLQATVNVVCLRRTVEDTGHTHQIIVSDPITAVRGSGRQDVLLTCGPGRVAIAPGYSFVDGSGRLLASRAEGTGWRFVVDASDAAGVELEVRCLSTTLTTANGHTHDLVFDTKADTVDVAPSQNTNDRTTATLTCTDGKGIVASTTYDPSLVTLGNEPQPVSRVFSFYNPSNATQTADIGLLCLGTRTSGEMAVNDVVNTATVTTSSPDSSAANDTASATFRATAASGSTDLAPTIPTPVAPVPFAPPAAPVAPAPDPAASAAAPSAPAPSAPTTTTSRTSVLSSSLRVTGTTSKASVAVPVRCTTACTGTAQLVATSALRSAGITKGAVLATASVKLVGGKKSTLRLVAKGKVAKALKRGGVKRAKLVLRTGKGTQVVKTVRLVLR
ncbi:unannotated protein [freshwater metagenome]|uniref:Unannotated protein n=1 Tax=freshwater metagenome TaxID=449393 RepID=A0A6J7IR05_9ZZZZ|nr:DUF11 domain-containing protein [Actinomycetota bacterium]